MAVETAHADGAPAHVNRPQQLRLREWHQKVHVMHIAQSKAAASSASLGRGLGITVAILTTFTGSTVFTTLVGSTTAAVRIAATAASIIAVLLVAAQTAFGFDKHSAEHKQAAVSFGRLRREMEKWRLDHPNAHRPDAATTGRWVSDWKNIESAAPTVSDRELWRAERRVAREYKDNPDPW